MPVDQFRDNLQQGILFTWIFFLFILSWISVAVVGRAIDNLTFTTLKLDSRSTFHTTVIAIVIIAIELATIYYFSCLGITIYSVPLTGDIEDDNTDYGISKIAQMHNIEIV